MKKYDEFIEGLQKDIEVPQNVWDKFETALSELPERPAVRLERRRRWIKAIVSSAAILIFGIGFCYANPALAAQIPIIGKIFEKIENTVTFSGDYKEKSEALPEDTAYTVEDNGVKLTASEVYCDGYSVFITAKIEVKAGGFTSIPSFYTSKGKREEKSIAQGIYMEGDWNLKNEKTKVEMVNNNFEGKVLDDYTYIGMLKVDLKTVVKKDTSLELEISQIGYDDKNMVYSEDENISASNKIKGNWKLSIPFTIDTVNVKEIEVNKKNEDGYGISKVFVSPYQLIVYKDVPYTTKKDNKTSKEEFDYLWVEKNKELEAAGEKPVTYEETLKEKCYAFCEMAVFNQDEEVLLQTSADNEKSIFAIKNLSINKLHIFLNDKLEEVPLVKATDINTAREKSIWKAIVDIK